MGVSITTKSTKFQSLKILGFMVYVYYLFLILGSRKPQLNAEKSV